MKRAKKVGIGVAFVLSVFVFVGSEYQPLVFLASILSKPPAVVADFQKFSGYILVAALITLYIYQLVKLKSAKNALEREREKLLQSRIFLDNGLGGHISSAPTPESAYFSIVTELPNRFLFENRIRHSMLKTKRDGLHLPLLILNLNRLKSVNESLGYEAGDRLLKQVAHRLLGCVRETDTVAHMGGDEFAIIVEPVKTRDFVMRSTTRIAQSILTELSRPFDLGASEAFTSVSMGIVFFPEDGKSVVELVKNATSALQHAKDRGPHQFAFYAPKMNKSAAMRLNMENNIRNGIEKGEFCLYYQPLLNFRTGLCEGAEALLRWRHPRFGTIPTSQFISLAEETGLIIPLGEWVIAEAMRQTKEWQDKGLKQFRVGINVSLHQARQTELLQFIRRMFDEIRTAPDMIAMELTETVFMADMENVQTLLRELGKLGVLLSIDDFGTGYSSLARLNKLPASSIKIDQSFVRDLTLNPDTAGIVKSIISMAHSLRMKVVAEGIETSDQYKILKRQGCDLAQGFLFGRPGSASAFESRLVENGLIGSRSMTVQ